MASPLTDVYKKEQLTLKFFKGLLLNASVTCMTECSRSVHGVLMECFHRLKMRFYLQSVEVPTEWCISDGMLTASWRPLDSLFTAPWRTLHGTFTEPSRNLDGLEIENKVCRPHTDSLRHCRKSITGKLLGALDRPLTASWRTPHGPRWTVNGMTMELKCSVAILAPQSVKALCEHSVNTLSMHVTVT